MIRSLILAVVLILGVLPAAAVEPGEMLADPVLEARAREISKGLRCLVCRNQSIDDSNAGIARDLRVLLRERLAAGDSDEQAVAFLVDRYGNYVLLKPPLSLVTGLLWFGPLVLLVAATLGFALVLRRPAAPATGTADPLDTAEREELDRILGKGKTS